MSRSGIDQQFVALNVSVNKNPFLFSAVLTNNKLPPGQILVAIGLRVSLIYITALLWTTQIG